MYLNRPTLAVLLIGVAVCVSHGQSPVTPGSSPGPVLEVGAAVVDVTPDQLPVLVNGSFLAKSADKIKTRVNARAIVLRQDDQEVALVVVDSCMIPQLLLDDVKQRAAQRTNLKHSAA